MPMPAMAATRHQRESSLPLLARARQPAGALTATNSAKTTVNQGSSGGRPAGFTRARAAEYHREHDHRHQIATRISFTKVATSPVWCDMA